MIDYDTYLAREIDKHMQEQEDNQIVSNCCGEPIEDDSDICSECGEHCNEITLGERDYELYENAMCDKADSYRELAREEN